MVPARFKEDSQKAIYLLRRFVSSAKDRARPSKSLLVSGKQFLKAFDDNGCRIPKNVISEFSKEDTQI